MADPIQNQDPMAPPAGDTPDVGDADVGAADDDKKVLLTVLANDDGTYTLVKGDEDEGVQDAAGALPGAPGEAGGDGTAGAGEAPQGEQFDSIGALLKGILDCLKEHEATASGQGSEDDNFNAGFTGAPGGAPTTKPVSAVPMGG